MTNVGTGAFYGCTSITALHLDCPTIGNWFADSKTKVQTLTQGEKVTTINANSFEGFSDLKKVYLGSKLTSVGAKAFTNCSKIEDVYCFAERYPTVERNAFENSYIDYLTLHVPAVSINNYKAHEIWGRFKALVPITDEELAIEGVTAENAKKAVIYNLNGQRISSPKKGINIINGRKVLTR